MRAVVLDLFVKVQTIKQDDLRSSWQRWLLVKMMVTGWLTGTISSSSVLKLDISLIEGRRHARKLLKLVWCVLRMGHVLLILERDGKLDQGGCVLLVQGALSCPVESSEKSLPAECLSAGWVFSSSLTKQGTDEGEEVVDAGDSGMSERSDRMFASSC